MTRFAHTTARWFSILALLIATPGIAIAIGWPAYAQLGYVLAAAGLALAIWPPLIGPFRLGGSGQADEFDRMIQMRGWLAACASASFAAIMGIILLLALGLMGHWSSMMLLTAMGTLLTYLLVVLMAVPTLVVGGRAMGDED